jgi:hypothetical protein
MDGVRSELQAAILAGIGAARDPADTPFVARFLDDDSRVRPCVRDGTEPEELRYHAARALQVLAREDFGALRAQSLADWAASVDAAKAWLASR